MEVAGSKIQEIRSFRQESAKSLLSHFPPIVFNQPCFGFYELNAEFLMATSPDFKQNLLNKHRLPVYDYQLDAHEAHSSHVHAAGSSLGGAASSLESRQQRQPLVKRLADIFMSQGLVALLEDLRSLEKAKAVPQLPAFVFTASRWMLKLVDAINAPINPWLLPSDANKFDVQHIKGDSWQSSMIRAFQWHPHCMKYAVAYQNDVVNIYSANQAKIVLKHPKQINVTCLAWKPHYTSIIAIGCADCIIIWDTDVMPVSIKPSSSCSFVLSKRFHTDIIDLQWYPKSDLLVSVASKDNQIIIWDVMLKTCVPIKRIGYVGFSLCKFSRSLVSTDRPTPIRPTRLFTADLSTTFRIWNPDDFSSEKWANLVSRCNSCAWSPDGSLLLFTCAGCPLIYSLKFLKNISQQELSIVCDLSALVFFGDQELSNDTSRSIPNDNNDISQQQYTVGGAIEAIEWDNTGRRLAVTFSKSTDNESNTLNVVAVFVSKVHGNNLIQLLPCGFVRADSGDNRAWPTSINFKPHFEQGALLSVAWSNATIQHVPLYFSNNS